MGQDSEKLGIMKTLKALLSQTIGLIIGAAILSIIILAQGWFLALAWNEALAPALNLATKMDTTQGVLIWLAVGFLSRNTFGKQTPAPRVMNVAPPREWPPAQIRAKAAPGASPTASFEEALKRARANAAEIAKKRTGSGQNGV